MARIASELKRLQENPIEGVTAGPVDPNNLYQWEGNIQGAAGSPFEGGLFKILIVFPFDYPLKPPHVEFKTPIYHPNIGSHGEICLHILKKGWTPKENISKVLSQLYYLLATPDPDDALSAEIASQYKTDRATYEQTAREWTQKHAIQT